MAQINLKTGETQGSALFPVGTNNDFVDAPGSSGETIYIANGTQNFGATFNDGGDTIVLSGSPGQFQIGRSGATVTLTNGAGLTVTFPAPDSAVTAANAPKFIFNNGTPGSTADDVTYTLTNTGTAINFTNTAAGSTAQPVTTTPSTVGGTPQPVGIAVTVTPTPASVEEGGAITYRFELSQAQAGETRVNVVTSGGTATAGLDYTPLSTQVVFAAGQTVQFLTVQTIDDTASEAAETVTITVTPPSGFVVGSTSVLTATINASDGPQPGSFTLTTGNDTATGTSADDRFVGAQDNTQPGKLLSANDIVTGGGGNDTIELTNSIGGGQAQVLADLDFSRTSDVDNIVTNYQSIQLGSRALAAGIVSVDTRTRTDAQNSIAIQNPAGAGIVGTQLDLTADADGNGAVDFNRALNVTMANSVADVVRIDLTASGGSNIDTGSNFAFAQGGGTVAPIDQIIVSGAANTVRFTVDSGAIGNGSTTATDGTLGGSLQLTSATGATAGNLVGTATRVDDEGVNITANNGALFNVVNASDGASRGFFAQVLLGTSLSDGVGGVPALTGSAASAYINGGRGNDTLNGTAGDDFLVGGQLTGTLPTGVTDNDTLNGFAGRDTLRGGLGNDTLNGGSGADNMDGGEGSDVYVFVNGELGEAGEVAADTGTAGTDFIRVTSATQLTAAQFSAVTGVEGVQTDVQGGFAGGDLVTGGVVTAANAEVTLNASSETNGIVIATVGNDDLNASAYTAKALTVNGYADIVTGAGADIVNLTTVNPATGNVDRPAFTGYTRTDSVTFVAANAYGGDVLVDGGSDTVNAGYTLRHIPSGGVIATLTGGDGAADVDVLTLGDAAGPRGFNFTAAGAGAYQPDLSGVSGFETIRILAGPAETARDGVDLAGSAFSYTIAIATGNVATGTTLTVDASALRGTSGTGANTTGGVITTLDANGELTTARASEVLTFSAAALDATRTVNVTGGSGADNITGGAGVDTLVGNAGDDFLTGGLGNDVLNGGDGNDTYVYNDIGGAATLVAGETITDSAGTDTIQVTSATAIADAAFGTATKSGVEVLTTNITTGPSNDGTAEVVLGANAAIAGLTTVNNGNDDVDASAFTLRGLTINTGSANPAGNTVAGNVTGTAQGDVVNIVRNSTFNGGVAAARFVLGAGNDQLNTNYVFSFNTAAATVLNGGDGNADEITIGGVFGVPGISGTTSYNFQVLGANFSNFEKLTVNAPDVGTSTAAGEGIDFNVAIGAANVLGLGTDGYFTVDASQLGRAAGFTPAATGDQSLNLTVEAAQATAISVLGGGAGDQIIAGAGADLLRGNGGNDAIAGGAGNDTIFGGDGNDILTGDAGTFTFDGAGNVTGITLTTVGTGGRDTINAGGGDDRILISVAQFNGDQDSINGGADNDTLEIVGQNANEVIADVGFAGTDTTGAKRYQSIEQVTLTGAPGGTAFNYQAGFFSEDATIRTINLGANASNSTVSVANYSVAGATLNDILVPNAGPPAVGANNATFVGSNFKDTFNLGVTNTALGGGLDKVFAGAGDDDIFFGNTFLSASDVVFGGTGTDTLNLSGGGTFTLAATNTANQATATGVFGVEKIVLATATDNTAGSVYNFTVDNTTFEGTNLQIDGSALRAAGVVAGVGVTSAETLTVNVNGNVTTNTLTVLGGGADDTLNGGGGADSLTGNGGIDTINGFGGNDTIDGGAGNDVLDGGIGADRIIGGADSDRITGGAGVDVIFLGVSDTNNASDGARDFVRLVAGDAGRAPADGTVETIFGFTADTDATVAVSAAADVISFGGAGINNTTSASIRTGFVTQTSVLGVAVENATSLLAAIQLIEQEFNGETGDQLGVVAFQYKGNTYIGNVIDQTPGTANTGEAFSDVVQLSGTFGSNSLFTVVDGGVTHVGLALIPTP